MGCAKTDTGITKFFTDHEKMYEWLIELIEKNAQKNRRTYLYAHNAEYDWYAIARNHFLDKKMRYVMFHPFFGIYNEKGYFLDTMAFYRTSLGMIGKMLGYPKGKLPMAVKDTFALRAYLERDVDIVLKSILTLKEKLKKLGFAPRKLMTSGQIAMTSFLTYNRKKWTEKHFTQYNEEKKRREIIPSQYPVMVREAYRGGDNQAYKIGKFENLTLIDINGLYGHVMSTMRFPDLASEDLQRNVSVPLFTKYLHEWMGVARVKIKVPAITLPYLPVRFAEYQVFPSNRTLRGTWTLEELQKAITLGYIIEEVEWCIRYKEQFVDNKPFNPFKEFIDHLYELEQGALSAEERAPIKMIRNNLSGKFAQHKKNKDYALVDRENVMDYINDGYSTTAKFADKYIVMKETGEYIPSYVNPIISTYVTALGRLRLYQEKCKVPFDSLYYNDTDSLLIDHDCLKHFDVSGELGAWKIECANQPAKILGEKRYYIGEQVKVSGLHHRERNKAMIDNESNVHVQRMYGLSMAFNSGDLEAVGSFRDMEMEMKPHNKMMLPLPEIIDEVNEIGR